MKYTAPLMRPSSNWAISATISGRNSIATTFSTPSTVNVRKIFRPLRNSDTVSVLAFPMTSIHFYDETADGLAPVAVSEAVRETLGDPPTLDTGLAWEAFQAGEPRLHADVHDADNPYNPDTTMDSEMYLPLGDHGIFIVSALNADTFGENDLTLVKLLAAITTRALDRTAHIQQLERQNDRLERFASVISHDLRNPLQVARGHLEQARTIHDSDHLDAVANAHDRMATLIEELLTLARKGESVNDTSEVALAEAVDTCWRNVASTEATLVTDTEWTV